MTFRAKPVVKRGHKSAWEAQDRRNLYLNIGFGLIVVLAIVILVIAAGVTYYNDHLASVGSVDGQNITKDDLSQRAAIDNWRLNESESRIKTALVAGHLTQAQSDAAEQAITQQRNDIASNALERIIDSRLQAKLAADEGLTVAPSDIDARLTTEATVPESRHVFIISVKPEVDSGSIEPTAAQTAAAKAKADQALKDLQGGKAWEDVAKTVSTDAATAAQAGDQGWLTADDTQVDEPTLKAAFAAAANTPTAVIQGDDGTFRIARVSEIVPAAVDDQYQAKIVNNKIDLAAYRAVVAADVLHQKLSDKIVADVTKAQPMRKVSEIMITPPGEALPPDAIKVRHILYSPNGDAQNASSVPASDPAWEVAHEKAVATYIRLQQNPQLFDQIARSESDEAAANGPTGSGGKLPYFGTGSSVDDAFLKAITAPGLTEGQLLAPVKSAFGWHVIQVMYRPTDQARMEKIKSQADSGKDFGVLARDESYGTSAGSGGDLGWIVKGELNDKLTEAIWATPVGSTSAIVDLQDAGNDNGLYLFKVFAEETRAPEGRQLDTLKQTAFSKWYTAKKDAAKIERSESVAPTN
jgi:parvulin-like peptidyl-prolyl isomerase